jgi:hypothetical protein
MEKYGFIYIWFDIFRKMYYVGSHWGTVDDGYICSSNRMRDAYRRRPENFKRKIVAKVYTNRSDLLEEEYRWLSLIPKEQLGKKYYNLSQHKNGHWSAENYEVDIKKRISQKTKEAMNRPEVREKYLAGLAKRDNGASRPEVRAKMSASNKGKNTGKDNSKSLAMAHAANRGRNISQEHKNKIKESGHFNKLNSMKVSCIYCDAVANPGNIGRYHNEKCKKR